MKTGLKLNSWVMSGEARRLIRQGNTELAPKRVSIAFPIRHPTISLLVSIS